jgi:hypothetical protein
MHCKAFASTLVADTIPSSFPAGDLYTLVPLPENILKAIAWVFKRAT